APRRELSALCVPRTGRKSRGMATRGNSERGPATRIALSSRRIGNRSEAERLAIRRHPAAPARLVTLHVGAPAQELLDLALVRVGVFDPSHDRCEPEVLAELQNRLAARVAVTEAGGLEQSVVEPAAEAK